MNIFTRVSKSFSRSISFRNYSDSPYSNSPHLAQMLVKFVKFKDWNHLCLFRLVILIGDVSVGKTCLLSRYLKN